MPGTVFIGIVLENFVCIFFYTMDLDLVQHKLLRIRIQDPKKFVTDTDPDQILYES